MDNAKSSSNISAYYSAIATATCLQTLDHLDEIFALRKNLAQRILDGDNGDHAMQMFNYYNDVICRAIGIPKETK